MHIEFETSSMTAKEVRGLIAFLFSLLSQAGQAEPNSTPTAQAPPPVQSPSSLPPTPTAQLVPMETAPPASEPPAEPPTTTRKRRTKAEIAAATGAADADDAAAAQQAAQAPANPTQGSAVPDAEANGTTQSATVSTGTVSADELRALLNSHIAKHSMEAAIAVLQGFGCNRVTEALALEPAKLNALAEALRG